MDSSRETTLSDLLLFHRPCSVADWTGHGGPYQLAALGLSLGVSFSYSGLLKWFGFSSPVNPFLSPPPRQPLHVRRSL